MYLALSIVVNKHRYKHTINKKKDNKRGWMA